MHEYELPFVIGQDVAPAHTVVASTIICQSTLDGGLLITQLEARHRGIPLRQWTLHDIGFRRHMIEIDHNQDLVVILDMK